MKRKDHHTLLIISPSSGKEIVQIALSTFWRRVLYAGTCLLLILAVAGIWLGFHRYDLMMQTNKLKQENHIALSKLENQKHQILYLHNQFEKIQKQAVFIQNYLGLNSNGSPEGNIGQGGGEISLPYSPDPIQPTAFHHQNLPVLASFRQPSKLTRQYIQQLDSDLDQIIDTLEKKQGELEYTPSISPVDPGKAWISCSYGYRNNPFTGKKEFHQGIDIAGLKGTPVLSPAKGTAVFLKTWGSMGLTVKIKHNSSFLTTYGHLLKANVQKGQSVKRGEIIGYMGISGRSTGPHLHYEVSRAGKRINPFTCMLDWNEYELLLANQK